MAACTGPQLHVLHVRSREKRRLRARWWLEADDYFLDSCVQPGVSLTARSILSLLFSLLHLRFCWRGTPFSLLTVPCYTSLTSHTNERLSEQKGSAGRLAFCGFCMWFVRLGLGLDWLVGCTPARCSWSWCSPASSVFRLSSQRSSSQASPWRQTACRSYVRTAAHRQRFSSFCLGFRTKDGRVVGVNLISMGRQSMLPSFRV